MTSPLPASDKLARRLAELEGRLKRLESGRSASQLSHSSIEDGAIRANDGEGNLRQQIGRQSDGTFAVTYANGPQPPTPSNPSVSARQLAIVVGWDGEFAEGAAKPGDFARVDVHMDANPEFEPTGATLYGSLVGEGALAIPSDFETHYVRLVAVTLSDVPSAPTAPVEVEPLAASAIAADWVYAGDVAADQITAGTLNADVTVSSTLSTSTEGARVQLSSDGLSAFDGDENQTVNIPTNSNQEAMFRGSVEAGGLVVTGDASFRSTENEISKSASLVLRSSTSDPQTPPTLAPTWYRQDVPAWDGLTTWGLQWEPIGGRFWTAVIGYNGYLISDDGEIFTPTPPNPYWDLRSFAFVGLNWYILYADRHPDHNGAWIWNLREYDGTTGEFTGENTTLDYIQTRDLRVEDQPILGAYEDPDFGQYRILVCQHEYANNRFRIRRHDADEGLPWLDVTNTESNPGHEGFATGVALGQFDFGSIRYVVKSIKRTDGQPGAFWSFHLGTGTYDTDHWFPTADNHNTAGFAWDGTNFWSLNTSSSGSARLVRYSGQGLWTGPVDKSYDLAYTWARSDGSTIEYETQVSPASTIAAKKRCDGVRVTTPTIPNFGDPTDPNFVHIYSAESGGTLYSLDESAEPSKTVRPWLSGTTTEPPVSNSFPDSTPATIRNPGGSLVISGSGRIQARTLEPFQMFARKSDTQSIPTNTFTYVTDWVSEWDTFGGLNQTTGQFTAPETRWYEIEFKAVFGAAFSGNSGHRIAYVDLNGTSAATRQLMPPPWQTNEGYGVVVKSIMTLTAGDVIRPQVWHGQGDTINILGNLQSGPMEWKVTLIR